jgi:hypothetical protein
MAIEPRHGRDGTARQMSEQLRSTERARSGITTEMRRMQTTISPVEHPGLYAVADEYATIHDSPPSHRGPMALTGGCMQVIKNVDIKLSYIADAEWEYGRRLCAEGGEHLSDAQVLEIEAKILEFHAKQMVEAKKAKDKMRIEEVLKPSKFQNLCLVIPLLYS